MTAQTCPHCGRDLEETRELFTGLCSSDDCPRHDKPPTAPSITVQVKHVYGIPTAYPVCEASKLFAAIAKTKTLTAADLHRIKKLGYQINQQAAPAFNL